MKLTGQVRIELNVKYKNDDMYKMSCGETRDVFFLLI